MKVKTVKQVYDLALQRRAILIAGMPRPKAAAFLISMQARTLVHMIQRGMTVYKKANK